MIKDGSRDNNVLANNVFAVLYSCLDVVLDIILALYHEAFACCTNFADKFVGGLKYL